MSFNPIHGKKKDSSDSILILSSQMYFEWSGGVLKLLDYKLCPFVYNKCNTEGNKSHTIGKMIWGDRMGIRDFKFIREIAFVHTNHSVKRTYKKKIQTISTQVKITKSPTARCIA